MFFYRLIIIRSEYQRLLDIANTQRNNNKYHYIVKIKQDREQIVKTLKELLSKDPELSNEKHNSRININDTIDLLLKIHDRFENEILNH